MRQFIKVLNQYADFKGRAGRKEYWMFILFNMLAAFAVSAVGYLWTGIGGAALLSYLYLMAVLIPSWAVTIRRLHDTGCSAWFLLVGLIPVIGWIWLLVVLILRGTLEDNHYGKNPVTMNHSRYHRKRSAAVALMLSSVFWLLTCAAFFISNSDWNERLILALFLPVGLFITGVLLFSKRMFSPGVGWSMILLSIVWLAACVLTILNSYSSLLTDLDIPLLINLLTIFVPLALFVSGLYIILKKSDRTLPACLLFAGAGIWILSIVLKSAQFKLDLSNTADLLDILSNAIIITVPVSLLVTARTLLSKEKNKEETDKQPIISSIEQQTETSQTVQPVANRTLENKPPVIKQPIVGENRRRVVFVREDKDNNNTWVIYKAPTKVDAMAFLTKITIDRPSYFVVVETPEGNFGRDKDGIYQE